MFPRPKQLYEFGEFYLNADEGLLLRRGEPVPLTRKALETLLVLVENSGRVVAKERFFDEVWADACVEDGSLTVNISLLRKALGHDEGGRSYIETVPRRGYRFIADVKTVSGGGDAELVIETQTRASIVVEEETDEDTPSEGGGAREADAVAAKPATEMAAKVSAQPVGNAERRLRNWMAPAATAVIIALAAVAYHFYPASGDEAIDSVAVLSFVNESGDTDAEYLAEGISDSLINSLSRLPNLRVISLNAVLRYKGRQIDPQQIGRELNVQAVLLGRMTQRGDALAISAEMVDARDNRRLWGGQYNRKPSDILAVQEEIAGEIAEKLRLRLGGAEKQRLAKHYTESAEAYDAYARGRFMLEKRTGPATEKSVGYFEQAIRLDPDYAAAYAALSYAYWSFGGLNARPPQEVLPKAKAAAAKALAIDDTLAETHVALGHIGMTDRDWAGAERAFRRAIELNPNSGLAHSNYSHHLRRVRRFDEAVAESKRAVEIEPTSVLYNRNVAMSLYFARRYDEAIEQFQKTLELDPDMPTAHSWLASSYEQKGLYQQAVEARLKGREFIGAKTEAVAELREAYASSGWKGYWRKELELRQEWATQGNARPREFAEIYARLGEKDQAFFWLEKACENPYFFDLNGDPFWDGLRSDPRFADLVRRLGFEP